VSEIKIHNAESTLNFLGFFRSASTEAKIVLDLGWNFGLEGNCI
jgi:hypothetical protein